MNKDKVEVSKKDLHDLWASISSLFLLVDQIEDKLPQSLEDEIIALVDDAYYKINKITEEPSN